MPQAATKLRAGIALAVTAVVVIPFLLITGRTVPTTVTELDSDEQIIFLPTHASYDADKKRWRVHLHAWVYEPETGGVKRRVAKAAFRKKIGVPDKPTARKRFEEIVGPFLYDNERGKTVVVQLGKRTVELGETDAAGHVRKTVELSKGEFDALPRKSGRIVFRAALGTEDTRAFRGSVLPIKTDGLSVISDIDDTIKITNVTDRDAMLANTFYRPFKPVDGMTALYQKLAKRGAVFHYVSASPWQLLGPLEAFRRKHNFPAGVFHLKRLRLRDVPSLDAAGNAAGKMKILAGLLREFPKRRFVLIGDSGEGDPEIYGELARKFSKQIVAIGIRNVTQQPRSHKRYKQAFRDMPPQKAVVFENPREFETRLTGESRSP